MQLQKTALLQNSITSSLSERAMQACLRARQHEEAGEFEVAQDALTEFWGRVGEKPHVHGLDLNARAELLLRVGTLSGWIGGAKQIGGAQEIAKDLISESVAIFEKLDLREKVAEGFVDLAICYWREGGYDEARITLQQVQQMLADSTSEQKLRALVNSGLVERSTMRYHEAFRILTEGAPLFSNSQNHALRGKFHMEFATVLKNLGLTERREDYVDRALVEYAAASFHFEEAGHKRFQIIVENNLGFLFVRLGKFEDAHDHLNRARSSAVALKDRGFVAQIDDTRARAFLAQEQYETAKQTALAAVRSLREGDQHSQLAEALTTYGTALARLGRSQEAMTSLAQAVNISEHAGDPDSGGIAALTILEELGPIVSMVNLHRYYRKAEEDLALSQHPDIQLRLGNCARKILSRETEELGTASKSPEIKQATKGEIPSSSLDEEVRRYEAQLIKQALDQSGGSVTRAARSLGITHQGLAFILNGRHKDLLSARTPIKPRRRSIIRYR